MKIEQHISQLVKNNDMVIIPTVGGIVAHIREAVINSESGILLPPGRSFSFNPKLTYQDGLLVQSFMQDHNISQNEAIVKVNLAIDELKKQLSSSKGINIDGVGTFLQNSDGHIQLIDNSLDTNSTDTFGLPKLQIEKLNKEIDLVDNKKDEVLPVKSPKSKSISINYGKWIAAAAVFLLMFLVTKPVSDESMSLNVAGPTFDFFEAKHKVAIQESKVSQPEVENQKQEEQIDKKRINEENISVLPEPPQTKYCIIVSSLANRTAAYKKLDYYKKAGFKNASIIYGKGRYRISIGNFSNKEIGISKLNEIRSFSVRYKDAWLLKSRI